MIIHYIKSFLSSIKKNKFFYSINLLGFLTGFLVLIIIFTFVYQELNFDKFHTKAENIYRINSGGYGVTPLCFGEKLHNTIPEISKIVRFSSDEITIIKNNEQLTPKKVYYTDSCVFNVFTFKLLKGNKENVLKDPYSVVISKSLSQQLFGDSSSIGNVIKSKSGLILKVTGIMEDIPITSHIKCDLFASIETLRSLDENAFNCGSWGNLTYLLLESNSDTKSVEEKINTLLEDFRMETSDGKIQLKVQSIKKLYFDYGSNKYDGCEHGSVLVTIIYAAVAVLLMILVIVNYVNLFVAISSSKLKATAIKKVLGANRSQIIKQFITEALGISFISFLIAIMLIELFLSEISGLLNINISKSQDWLIMYSWFFVGVTVIGLITGIISGYSISKLNAIKILKNESFFKSRGFQRKVLLTIQLMIVSLLLNSTFIIKNQIQFMLKKDLGFNYENVVYFSLDDKLLNKKDVLKSKLLNNPNIKNVSFSSSLIGNGFGKASIGNEDNSHLCYFYSIDPEYVDFFKLRIKDGRNFSQDLKTDFENSCIINESACKTFGFENPINEMLGSKQIIGVVKDFNYNSLHNSIEPLVINCGNDGNIIQIKITENEVDRTLNSIKKICYDLSAEYNCNVSFLDDRITELYKFEFELKKSLNVYSIITLVIALLGIFGLALFMIRKKYKEISIRKLFGAKLKDTFLILVKEYFIIICISNLLAFPLSYLVKVNYIAFYQYQANIGFFLYIKTFLIVFAFTLLAITYMILKSHRLNPINALKEE